MSNVIRIITWHVVVDQSNIIHGTTWNSIRARHIAERHDDWRVVRVTQRYDAPPPLMTGPLILR